MNNTSPFFFFLTLSNFVCVFQTLSLDCVVIQGSTYFFFDYGEITKLN